MKIKTIVLDFGHGGLDPNNYYTTSPNKMYKHANGEVAYEGVLNRQIGGHLYTYLRNNTNLDIKCTVREDNYRDITLQQRVRITNKYPARETLFISIHCNAGGGTGFEIFTTRGNTRSDILAERIADSVEGLYKENKLRLRFDLSDGDKDKEAQFYVLKHTFCPAVLVECGFFDNYDDYLLLKDGEFQSKLALSLCRGIMKYVDEQD